MFVGIDASRATPPPRTGTENYSVGLIQALVERGQYQYRLYYRDRLASELEALSADRCRLPARRLWTHTRLAWELLRRPPDALLVPAHVLPLTHPRRSVVTVHDVGFRLFPQAHPASARLYLELSTRWAAWRAAHLLADSEATRRDVVRLYGVAPDRVSVVYPAVGTGFTPTAETGERERLAATYGLTAPYVLYVGTLQPRKNVGTLVKAMAHVAPGLMLAVVGGVGWGGEAERLRARVEALGLTDRVRFLGHAPAADLPALMRQALALALPSLHEGFGMPLAEAMACGTPTLAADSSCLPEVVGDAGLLLPPHAPAAWADALGRIVGDADLRRELGERGQRRAALFTWDRAAAIVERVLASLA